MERGEAAPRTKLDLHSPTRTYEFESPQGFYLFEKRRYDLPAADGHGRSKTFRYFNRATGSFKKPEGADRYLYRLPTVLRGIRNGEPIHWTEGEKDADALQSAGVCATSHHQGAGHVTAAQAEWLCDARLVILWVDKDVGHWEVGAYDAVLRYNLLMDANLSPARVKFVCARRGKDAYDHLIAGYSLDRARPVDKDRLAGVARAFRPRTASRLGYPRG